MRKLLLGMMMILIILTVIEVQAIDIIMSSFFYPSLVSITLPQLSKVDVIHSSFITLKRELMVVSEEFFF